MTTLLTGWLDVTDHGAQGNGTHNDTLAIQACANFLATAPNFGVLYFPPGTYPITDSIEIPTQVSVLGCGTTTSVIRCDVNNSEILTLTDGATAVSIAHLGLAYADGLAHSPDGIALVLNATTLVRITDVEITNPPSIGLQLLATDFTDHCGDTIVDQLVVKCNAHADAAVQITGGGNSAGPNPNGGNTVGTSFFNCSLEGTASGTGALPAVGFDLENCQATKVISCKVSGFGSGLNLNPRNSMPPYSSVYGVLVSNSDFSVNTIGCNIQYADGNQNIHRVDLFGSNFSGCSNIGIGIVGFPSALKPLTTARVSGCTIGGNGAAGIHLAQCVLVQVVGCGLYGNDQNGTGVAAINVGADTFNILIESNQINASGGGHTSAQALGIAYSSASANSTVIGCDMNDVADNPPVSVVGADGVSIYNSPGFNPGGLQTPHPTMPPSGTPLPNPFASPVTIYTDSTVSSLTIDGVAATGNVGGVLLNPGQSVTPTHGSPGNWQWFMH